LALPQGLKAGIFCGLDVRAEALTYRYRKNVRAEALTYHHRRFQQSS
jgi:hypothetical protein